jgi:hypothetical protein
VAAGKLAGKPLFVQVVFFNQPADDGIGFFGRKTGSPHFLVHLLLAPLLIGAEVLHFFPGLVGRPSVVGLLHVSCNLSTGAQWGWKTPKKLL